MQKRIILAAIVSAAVCYGCSLDEVVDRGETCPPRAFVDDDGNLVKVSISNGELIKVCSDYKGIAEVSECIRPSQNSAGEYVNEEDIVLFRLSDYKAFFDKDGVFPGISYIQNVCADRDECMQMEEYKEVFEFNVCPKSFPACGMGDNGFFCKKETAQCQTDSECSHFGAGWKLGKCEAERCILVQCDDGYTLQNGNCSSQCGENEHMKGGVCEPDSVNECGSATNDCTTLPNVGDAEDAVACVSGKCVINGCASGYKLVNNQCVSDCAVGQHYDSSEAKCVDDDPDNCGATNNKCSAMIGWGDGDCVEGQCQATSCSTGYTLIEGKCSSDCPSQVYCNNICIDPQTDMNHCGAKGGCSDDDADSENYKGQKCENGNVCTLGTCAASCLAGSVFCGGKCVIPGSDPEYCGATGTSTSCESVGVKCSNGQVCASGECSASCLEGQVYCGGKCIDPTSDASFCGATGDSRSCTSEGNICGTGQACVNSVCVCPEGQTFCNVGNTSLCIDSASSNKYCGCSESDAGHDCTASGQICSSGGCATTCATGTDLCKGTCIDIAATHVSSCTDSSISCESDYADVDGKVSNGCEVYLKTDNNNCGQAGKVCPTGQTCVNGSCTCPTGQTYCKTGNNTFACVDGSNSNEYCGCSNSSAGTNCTSSGQICTSGSCATTCATGTELCKGTCIDKSATHVSSCTSSIITCESGYADVDGKASNGCEVNLKTDNNNCGAKGTVCANGQSCVNGSCFCPTGLTYCKTGSSTYACIDASSSNQYCGCTSSSTGVNCFVNGQICTSGSCATTCATGTELCKGTCIDKAATHVSSCTSSIITCESSYADVDGKASNGCEVNLKTDNNNCGAIGTVCTNGRLCSNGSCTCPSGQTYCKTGTSTYACIDASSSNQYCGCSSSSSGVYCSSGQICSSGSCSLSCQAGLTNCNGTCIDTTATHVSSCSSGSVSCVTGYDNCDGTVSNGCEVKTNGSDNSNCGGCNRLCMENQYCSNGSCVTSSSCPNGTYPCGGGCMNSTTLSALHMTTSCTCVSGWSDANSNKSDGCESSTSGGTSVTDCGSSHIDCTAKIGWGLGNCTNGNCDATSCSSSLYTLDLSSGYGVCRKQLIINDCPSGFTVDCSRYEPDSTYCCDNNTYCGSFDSTHCRHKRIIEPYEPIDPNIPIEPAEPYIP